MQVISFVLVVLILSAVCSFGISWSVHISQTKEFSDTYGWGNLSQLKRELSKHDWIIKTNRSTSMFDLSTNSEIHASIVRFDGKGMVLYPLAYLWLIRYSRRRTVRKHSTVDWSKKQT